MLASGEAIWLFRCFSWSLTCWSTDSQAQILRAALPPRWRVACGFVDIEAAVNVRLMVSRHGRFLVAGAAPFGAQQQF
jgi:hypothetical protein